MTGSAFPLARLWRCECYYRGVDEIGPERSGVLVARAALAEVGVAVFHVLGQFFDDVDFIHGADVESGEPAPDDAPPIRHCRAQ